MPSPLYFLSLYDTILLSLIRHRNDINNTLINEVREINTIFESNIDLSIFDPFKIDCNKCSGLCCVALYFTRTDGFPKDKEAGVACKNLQSDYKCKIHSKLSQQGLKGCIAYDCFGAGQHVTRYIKSLPDWLIISKKEADVIFNSYLVVLKIHQALWYLSQCLILCLPQSEKEQAKLLVDAGTALIEHPLEALSEFKIKFFCEKSNDYLKYICSLYQKTPLSNSNNMQINNYMGKNMKRKNLVGKDFSMSLLIAANLEQANLDGANFLGADMRDTNIQNTDLSQCLFLTQIQINAARGNNRTILPPFLHKPEAWNSN